MASPIKRYCKAHETIVTITRRSGEGFVLLMCDHTAPSGPCDRKCVYSFGAQIGVKTAALANPAILAMGVIRVNSDGTIPLDVLERSGCVDYTSELPSRSREYFEVACPAEDGFCGDRSCPCPPPGTKIPRGTGYLYISQEVVDFRRDARSAQEAQEKMNRTRKELDVAVVIAEPGVIQPILMCEQGAKLRGLDLNAAAADAKFWWETGLVPLRATPQAKKWWQFWK